MTKSYFYSFIILGVLVIFTTTSTLAKEPNSITITWRDLWSALKTEGEELDSIYDLAEMLSALTKREGEVAATRRYMRGYAKLSGEPRFLALWLSQYLPIQTRIQVAVTLLNSDDVELRDAAQEFLLRIQKYVLDWKNEYVEYLRHHHLNRPPNSFLILMVDHCQLGTLQVLAKAYGHENGNADQQSEQEVAEVVYHALQYHLWMIEEGPPIEDAQEKQEHVQAARKALMNLLDLDRWWASVFAAAMARDYQFLRTPELKRRLLAIDNPLVQQRTDWAHETDPEAEEIGPLEAGDSDVKEVETATN